SSRRVWHAPALAEFTRAKFWIHAAIRPLKSKYGLKAAHSDAPRYRAERARANMKHGNCATGTRIGSAAKALRKPAPTATKRSHRCSKDGTRWIRRRSTRS